MQPSATRWHIIAEKHPRSYSLSLILTVLEGGCGYKWLKRAFSGRWMVSALAIGWGSEWSLLHIDTTRLRLSPAGSGVPACPTRRRTRCRPGTRCRDYRLRRRSGLHCWEAEINNWMIYCFVISELNFQTACIIHSTRHNTPHFSVAVCWLVCHIVAEMTILVTGLWPQTDPRVSERGRVLHRPPALEEIWQEIRKTGELAGNDCWRELDSTSVFITARFPSFPSSHRSSSSPATPRSVARRSSFLSPRSPFPSFCLQLSKLNSATLLLWLKARGVNVNAKHRKEELMMKVRSCLAEAWNTHWLTASLHLLNRVTLEY